ncbi:hypothetical protein ACFQ5M_06765 [Agrilactobacillus yilanensis]|uniref:Glycosyl hydrolases family 2 sugar binding domain-containing protein n=1 Tax=Agrilactobacillus yilanensis TaxID=2485997 RepID=A0ABW4J5Y0_9LACO|nr:hypothetical protein [Agrilactobacillus yilanensis]
MNTVIRLDEFEHGGFLKWNVPEGKWRIFVLFETPESAGRPYFMNLLSKESVALELEKVHQPLYEHLKDESSKSWLGFFYDEPEIGNNGGDAVFDYFMLPGKRGKETSDCDTFPWSSEMAEKLAEFDEEWLLHLPSLWYDAGDVGKDFRRDYMNAVSLLVRDNYNGQVYAFCQEKGIGYIGHVLEDEGCHDKLGCGPSHYFRQQYYQDEAGIDVIAGQIMPGKDGVLSWYGAGNADGSFYHYGLAKLAASEAHINPIKNNRSFSEVFAMYGQQGMAERKFLIDHLLVNGVNRMLFMEEFMTTAREEYTDILLDYTDRMCQLLRTATPIREVAILYHAEAEWREGDKAGKFHRIGSELARHQIGYDVIPADVFAFPEKYLTNTDNGLEINGHAYRCLIIPACEALPEEVKRFTEKARLQGFPIIFVDRVPDSVNIEAIQISDLFEDVNQRLSQNLEFTGTNVRWLRTSHIRMQDQDIYLLHNEAPQGAMTVHCKVKDGAIVRCEDPVTREKVTPSQKLLSDGTREVTLTLGQYEMTLLMTEQTEEDTAVQSNIVISERPMKWTLRFPDGQVSDTEANIPTPEDYIGYSFDGALSYQTMMEIEDVPKWIDLGYVSDCCEMFINGESAGKRMSAPYRFRVDSLLKPGTNKIVVNILASAGNGNDSRNFFGVPAQFLTALPYSEVLPMGLRGPVCEISEM